MAIGKFYNLDTDNTLGGNNTSDIRVPSQKAVKEYVDNNAGTCYFDIELSNGTEVTPTPGGYDNEYEYPHDGTGCNHTVQEIYDAYLAGKIIRVTELDMDLDKNIVTFVYDESNEPHIQLNIVIYIPWAGYDYHNVEQYTISITNTGNTNNYFLFYTYHDHYLRDESNLKNYSSITGENNTLIQNTHGIYCVDSKQQEIATQLGYNYFFEKPNSYYYDWIIDQHRHWWDAGKGSYTYIDLTNARASGDSNFIIRVCFDGVNLYSQYASAGADSPAVFFNKPHRLLIKIPNRLEIDGLCVSLRHVTEDVEVLMPVRSLRDEQMYTDNGGLFTQSGAGTLDDYKGKAGIININHLPCYIELNAIALPAASSKNPVKQLVINSAPFNFESSWYEGTPLTGYDN